MNNIIEIITKPIFFERNRVFRVYKGGLLFSELFGDEKKDGNFPEEWIASSVRALNKDSINEKEGISKIEGTNLYFDELLEKHKTELLGNRKNFGVLVKTLDSAIRLPIQAHPDKPFSRKYFHSDFGKAESWLILATRENAKIYFGFKDAMTKEEFSQAVEESETDKDVMETLLNPIDVKKGDIFFIPAKAVHAIGYGCLILEVQEATDFTIQPEGWCGDYHLDNFEKYLGLSKETALNCFDYDLYGKDAVELGRKQPKIYEKTETFVSEELIGSNDTDCFGVVRHTVKNGNFKNLFAPSVCVVTEGNGEIICGEYKKRIKKGDYFFLPYVVNGKCEILSQNEIEIVECLPSEK